MKVKRVMIIGGRWRPDPLVRAAKELGCWVLATHYSRSITAVPGADAVSVLYPRDITKAVTLFRAHDIEAIVYDSDDNALYAGGALCNRFGLPGPTPKAVAASTDKKLLRTICRKHDIPQPEFYAASSLNDLREGIKTIGGFPAVVKPVDNQGGMGVIRVENQDELEKAFRFALTQSYSRKCIIERFIEGAIVNVAGFSPVRGQHIIFTTGSKRVMPGKRLLTAGLAYPADADRVSIGAAVALHKKAVDVLGYDFGLSHSEIVIDKNGKPWLIEAANRGEAWLVSSLALPAITGFKINHELIRLATGETGLITGGEISAKKSIVVALMRFRERSERMKKIPGLDKTKAMPGVLHCEFFYREGAIIIPAANTRVGYVITAAETPREAEAIANDVGQILQVELVS